MPVSITAKETLEKQYINPPTLSKAAGYSHAVAAIGGKVIYVSGQVAYDKEGRVVGKGKLDAQAKQVYENIAAALAGAKAGFADVIKVTAYVVDLNAAKAKTIRDVREAYMPAQPPASTMIGVSALVNPDLMLEIEVVAVVPTR